MAKINLRQGQNLKLPHVERVLWELFTLWSFISIERTRMREGGNGAEWGIMLRLTRCQVNKFSLPKP